MESEDRKPIFTKRLILIILAVILLILITYIGFNNISKIVNIDLLVPDIWSEFTVTLQFSSFAIPKATKEMNKSRVENIFFMLCILYL